MPVLARFYGIVIRMYFLQKEHNPPHIHAIYNEDMAAIDFMTGRVLEGYLPPKALSMGTGMDCNTSERIKRDMGNAGV